MATSGSFDSKATIGGYVWHAVFDWTSINNSPNISWTLSIYRENAYDGTWVNEYGSYVTIDGIQVHANASVIRRETDKERFVIASGTKTIANKNFNMSFEVYLTSNSNKITGFQTWELSTFPQYANFTEHRINSTSLNSISVFWNADVECDAVQYSLNGTDWKDASGLTYTISNLTPNTNYSIKTRIKRADSQLWAESETLNVTTQDIGKITSVNDFEHGSNVDITITNPSSSELNLEMKIEDTQILTKTINAGTNTISFTDSELDEIYKKYGSSNILTATFILSTANAYTNSKTCLITLKGNQKTVHKNISGIWHRGKVYIKVNNVWRKSVVWKNINGIWRRCI